MVAVPNDLLNLGGTLASSNVVEIATEPTRVAQHSVPNGGQHDDVDVVQVIFHFRSAQFEAKAAAQAADQDSVKLLFTPLLSSSNAFNYFGNSRYSSRRRGSLGGTDSRSGEVIVFMKLNMRRSSHRRKRFRSAIIGLVSPDFSQANLY